MWRAPDSLRSERFSLQKMAIEKGLYGDSLVGTVELPDVDDVVLLEADSASSKEAPE